MKNHSHTFHNRSDSDSTLQTQKERRRGLTRSHPGNTCRCRRRVPRGKDERRYKRDRLWRRGGSVGLRGQRAPHAAAHSVFPSSHPQKMFFEKPPSQQSMRQREREKAGGTGEARKMKSAATEGKGNEGEGENM